MVGEEGEGGGGVAEDRIEDEIFLGRGGERQAISRKQ